MDVVVLGGVTWDGGFGACFLNGNGLEGVAGTVVDGVLEDASTEAGSSCGDFSSETSSLLEDELSQRVPLSWMVNVHDYIQGVVADE